MCDMDCGSDVGIDADVSEGADFDCDLDVNVESSFEGMDDMLGTEELEGNIESGEGDFETAILEESMEPLDESASLSDFDDIEEFDNMSQEEFNAEDFMEVDNDTIEINTDLFEEEQLSEEEIMEELSQLDAIKPEMWDAAVLEEVKEAHADNPEFIEGIDRLIDEGKIEVVDSSEVSDEIPSEDDGVKVLTREITDEVLESRERDTNVVLENYRENLEARGVAEEQINDLEDRMVEITATEQNIEKRMKRNEDSLRDLWDNIKCTNICIIGVPEGEEREKRPEKIFPNPCAISSVFELCLSPIMPSDTTHERSDSIAARIAIVNALGKRFLIVRKSTAGTLNFGSEAEISYKSPIVLTFILNAFTIITPSTTTTKEPGIFLLILGHIIRTASAITPTKTLSKFTVANELTTAESFSIVSTA